MQDPPRAKKRGRRRRRETAGEEGLEIAAAPAGHRRRKGKTTPLFRQNIGVGKARQRRCFPLPTEATGNASYFSCALLRSRLGKALIDLAFLPMLLHFARISKLKPCFICIISRLLAFSRNFSRSTKDIYSFCAHLNEIFVPLTAVESTSARKYSNKFGISLAYSYLCTPKSVKR